MPGPLDQSFIKQYEAEVHAAYQRQGSKLRNTVRNSNNVVGATDTFQKVGKGTASTKTPKGLVPTMNVDHTPVEVTLQDFYAGDWNDAMDNLKTNIDERQVITNAGAYALGRKTDDLIITALSGATTNTIAHGGTGMTITKALKAMENLGEQDVPMDDGQVWSIIGWQQWNNMLTNEEFVNSQWIGPDDMPFKTGMYGKKWNGQFWMPHSGLPAAGGIRKCFMYHMTSVGHSSGSEVKSDITWHGDRASWFINNMMSQGAGLIDELGVCIINCQET